MSKDDWYRNSDWGFDIETAFRLKLKRARDKSQYLRIQASYLSKSYPEVSLELLNEYFLLENKFDYATAFLTQANCYITLHKYELAIEAFRNSLKREAEFPNLKTQAYLELPYFIVMNGLEENYIVALNALEQHKNRLTFAIDHFKWNSCKAILATHFGEVSKGREFAQKAITAASQTSSGLSYHPTVGLVSEKYATLISSLQKMVST